MALIKITFIFLMINTWALEDRALFSIGQKVYFSRDANRYVQAMNFLSCYYGKKTLTHKLLSVPSNIKYISPKSDSLSNNESSETRSVSNIVKTLQLTGKSKVTLLSSKLARKCSLNKEFRSEINDIIAINNYLRDRVISKDQTPSQIDKSLKAFLASINDKFIIRKYQ